MNSFIEEYAVQFIQVTLITLVGLFLFLMIWVILRRIILNRRKRKFDQSEKKVLPILHRYLDGEISRLEFSETLDSQFDIVSAFRNVNLMIENLEGDEKTALKGLLEIPDFKGYYLKKLRSSNIMDISQASMYFEKKNITDKNVIERLQELQYHSNSVVAYASTMALINATNQKIRDLAFKRFMKRPNNASMALNDIVFLYTSSHEDKEFAAVNILNFISDETVPAENSAAALKVLTEIGAYHASEKLIELFQKELPHDKKGVLTASIIDVLHKLANRDISSELKEKSSWESPYQCVRLATAEWLQDNYSTEFKEALITLLHDKDLEVRIAAMKALLKVSEKKPLEQRLTDEQRIEWIEMKNTEGKNYADLS